MSGKFFAQVSDSESESTESEEDLQAKPSATTAYVPTLWLLAYSFSDEEEEAKRVVRTAREKRYEELQTIIKQIRNHKKIKDIAKMLTGFESLAEALVLQLEVEGDDEDAAPAKKADSAKELKSKSSKFLKGDSDDESDDESDWPSSDSDESSSSSDDEKYGANPALKFLKKEGDDKKIKDKRQKKRETEPKSEGDDKKIKDKRQKKRETEPKSGKRAADDEDGEWEKVKGGATVSEKPKMFAKDAEINHQVMVKKLVEVLSMRGKKRIDRTDQIDMLSELLSISEQHSLGPALAVKILFGIISSLYDYNANINSCMKYEMWEKCLETCERGVDTLIANPDVSVGENIAEESEIYVSAPYRVHGCVLTLIERMDEEFTKILQGCDAHSPEYIERLKDETRVCAIIERLQSYLETGGRGNASELCRIYILRIDHLYYKFDPNVFKKKARLREAEETAAGKPNGEAVNGEFKKVEIVIEDEKGEPLNKGTADEAPLVTSMDIMNQLCKYIYSRDVTDRIRTQAILCHIYHHALHLLTKLRSLDYEYSIDIQGRAKELLAQGLLPRQNERTPEQEKLEKRRQIPFHKHINLELLECVYLVSAMLLEIPDVASNEFSVRKKMISRSFYNQLRKNEEQPLVGVPESMREHVVAASKVMRVGNWRQCQEYIINDKMNSKVWNLFYQSDRVREMLAQKIREESLRAYLFTYSYVYDSISIERLAEMFDLETAVVHSIISKMIINEELMASLDEPTQTAIMHRTEPSRIQGLALQCAEKINTLVEQNERLWEMKQLPVGQFQLSTERRGYGQDREYRNYNRNDRSGYQDRHQYRRGSNRQDRGDNRQHHRHHNYNHNRDNYNHNRDDRNQ
ncbi:unnamed protein product [Oppiella nova]|uniref:Eukaryotic translation initiation factor 3 subunit C n=1 Tax=Oppiella nova TaxID=334625 RepID=A0A7R9QJI9_9ACAR|nr:unnamed protein product [Oppiella nova]CAG2166982.1 unnamed protein product [Oppiella nova]